MPGQREILGLLVALEFVVLAAFVFLMVPFDVAAPLLPLGLAFLVALYRYLG